MERNKKLIILAVWVAVILIVGVLVAFSPHTRVTCETVGNQQICSHCPVQDVNATAFSCNGSSIPAK